MKKTYLLLLVIAFGLLASSILIGGAGIAVALDLPSLLFVVGLALVMSLMGGSLREIGGYFGVVFKGGDKADMIALKKAAGYFRSLRLYLLLSGFCGTMAGTVVMLSVLSDNTTIGRGMALALITMFYAIILTLTVAVPFEQAACKLLAEKGE